MDNEYVDYFNEEDKLRLAKMLTLARAESGMSQEKVALELGVAKKTVQNWEKGISAPTLPLAIGWFRVMKVAAMPYLIQFLFPDLAGKKANPDDDDIRTDLISLIETVPAEGIKQIMYLLYGNHGSSPRATLNIMTAHLQCPMRDRYKHAATILNDYELATDLAETPARAPIKPNIEIIEKAIECSRKAIISNNDSYLLGN